MGERSRTACGSVRLTLCNSREGGEPSLLQPLNFSHHGATVQGKNGKIGPIHVVIASSLPGICQSVRVDRPYGIVTQLVTTEVGPRFGVLAP